jgi:hypothetical protein
MHPAAPRVLPLVAVLLGSCACPDFDDMQVSDPEGLTTAEERGSIRQAISDFARWTGEEGVCVPAIELREELADGYAVGTYSGPRKNILQVPGAGHSTAVHELCHAIDERMGWMSEDHPRLFPVGHIDPVLYPYRSIQVHESMARICEFGPQGLDLQATLEETCGWELAHPGQDLILREVYDKASPVRTARSPGVFSFSTTSLDSLVGPGLSLMDVASGEHLVWLLISERAEEADPELLGSTVSPRAVVLRGVEPRSGELVAEHRLTIGDDISAAHARVFRLADAAGEGALLIESAAATTGRIWELDDQTGELRFLVETEVSLGDTPNGLLSVRMGGQVVLLASGAQDVRARSEPPDPSSGGDGWLAVDLESGAVIEDDPLAAVLNRTSVWFNLESISAIDGGAQLSIFDEAGVEGGVPQVFTYAAGAEELSTVSVSAALLVEATGLLPSGELLGLWADVDYWNGSVGFAGMVLVDPETRDWRLPPGTCTGSDPDLYSSRIFHLGDTAWILGSERGTPVLAELVIEG